MNVKEERLNVNDLYDASSVFITNSLIGALPVVQFENKNYSITPELLNSINSIIEEENSL
jgi:4-amino-4-deoxychorismate lyase